MEPRGELRHCRESEGVGGGGSLVLRYEWSSSKVPHSKLYRVQYVVYRYSTVRNGARPACLCKAGSGLQLLNRTSTVRLVDHVADGVG